MKEGIHPEYYQATVTCNCGNTFVTGSTKKDIHVEICSKCHSFYTGQQKAAAARGRIDKFNRKYGITKQQFHRHYPARCFGMNMPKSRVMQARNCANSAISVHREALTGNEMSSITK